MTVFFKRKTNKIVGRQYNYYYYFIFINNNNTYKFTKINYHQDNIIIKSCKLKTLR